MHDLHEVSNMTPDTRNHESVGRQRAAIVMAVLVIVAALLATMYGLSTMAGLIAGWLAR